MKAAVYQRLCDYKFRVPKRDPSTADRALVDAVAWKYLTDNPASNVKPPRRPNQTSTVRQGETMTDETDTNWEMLNNSSIAESPPARAGLLLTIPEAAAALRISRSSIYRMLDSGELSWVLICGKRRVSMAEINRFIAAHTGVA